MKRIFTILMLVQLLASTSAKATVIYPSLNQDTNIVETACEAPQTERVYLGRFYICGYDACERCCSKTDGITKSGTVASVGRTIAAPSRFDYGTRLYIEGIGERVVEDRGYLGENTLDVFCEDHEACYAVTGWCDVYEIKEVP